MEHSVSNDCFILVMDYITSAIRNEKMYDMVRMSGLPVLRAGWKSKCIAKCGIQCNLFGFINNLLYM
jgi:hypothetical protein